MPTYLSNHKITTLYGECVMQHDQATIRLDLRERCKRALDLPFFFDWDWIYIDFECVGSCPYRLQKQICVSIPHRVEEESNVLNGRHKLSQNLNPFGSHREFKKSKSRSGSSRTRQTRDEPLSDRIAYVHEYRGDALCFSLHCHECRGAFGHKHVGRYANQLRGVFT